ncbi:hypothetical protein AN958_11556 [Leucoagaricus sp. SymC.cos]|nr:hypothetical protein AN958_11556 [Leucoagaricus sp. SymC.cos]
MDPPKQSATSPIARFFRRGKPPKSHQKAAVNQPLAESSTSTNISGVRGRVQFDLQKQRDSTDSIVRTYSDLSFSDADAYGHRSSTPDSSSGSGYILSTAQYEEYQQLLALHRGRQANDGTSPTPPPPVNPPLPTYLDPSSIECDEPIAIDWDSRLRVGHDAQGIVPDEHTANEHEGNINGNSPTEEASTVPDLRLDALCNVLQSQELRHALCNLQGSNAQIMIDYLYAVLSKPKLPKPWLRRHCLIALYKLSKSSLLYPHCYTLKDVVISGSSREAIGGFSDIHMVQLGDIKLCLKVVRLSKSNTEYMLKLYAKEAILWGQLKHPNIAPFYGVYYRDDLRREICLVSPWMHNGDLVQFLKNHPTAPRAHLVYDVAAGLEYLHDLRLVHGDMKGANVLVNDFGRACITDFGMSFIHTDKTLANVNITKEVYGGSIRWTAPELVEVDESGDDAGSASNRRPTFASDVWALGCVLYQIMTGSRPFPQLSDFQVTVALMKKQKPGLPSIDTPDRIKKTIWEEVNRCFVIEPRNRPKAREISQRLQWAGLSQWNDEEARKNEERTRQNFMHATQMTSTEVLDLEKVEQVFRGLDASLEQNLVDLLLEMLSSILSNDELRQGLCDLTGNTAQIIVDYLYSVLLEPMLPTSWLRQHSLSALVKINRTTSLCPACHVMKKSIVPDLSEVTGRTADIRKGLFGEKQLRLKVLRTHQKPDVDMVLQMYAMEVIVWGQLNHPNISPFYGLYYLDDSRRDLCLVSPWMRNGTLLEYLASNRSVSRTPFVYDVISGLEHLHHLGLIHGNLKGTNILVNDYHRACLTDFGVSSTKSKSSARVSGSFPSGLTIRWAAPELIFDGVQTTVTSDIWAFGCVCHEILTGKVPFYELRDETQVLRALLEYKTPTRPTVISNPIKENIWKQVDRCWLRHPKKRPTSQEIRLALESAGLCRRAENTGDEERWQQHFRDAMGLGDGGHPDLNAVKNIFGSLLKPTTL